MKTSKKNKRVRLTRRDSQNVGIVFCLPIIAGVFLIFCPLVVSSLRYAFSSVTTTDNGYHMVFVGLENFYYALRVDATYIKIMTTEVVDLCYSLPTIIILSLFIAVLLNRKIPGRTIFRSIFFVPVVISVGVVSRVDSFNLVMNAMSSAGVDTGADITSTTGIGDITTMLQNMAFSPTLVSFISGLADRITSIINQCGVQILINLAALQSIPESVFEAADVEGATAWEKFWKITLPMVAPMMLVNIFYTIIEHLTADSSELYKYVYKITFSKGQVGQGAAMSWLYLLILVVVFGTLFSVIKLSIYFNRNLQQPAGQR